MQELIQQLTQKAGLSPDQAQKALTTIADFVKDKFPMLGGAVDQMFTGGGSDGDDKSGGSGLGGFGSGLGNLGGFGK
jgi:hypothetical protein